MNKKIVLSGIQPTGNIHIGNYLGAFKNCVDLQNSGEYECYFFIADYHSLTGNMIAEERHEQTIRTAAELLAMGIDPQKSTFFVQSSVPECTELAWIFNTISPVAELERMTQFKDKSLVQTKNVNTGLLTYPLLQASDILLYHGDVVPVGQDQVQHVELTRNVARWFNNRYGDYFPETEPLLTETPKIMSLIEPDKKMSKSKGPNHMIEIADEPEVIEKKLKKAVTASEGGGASLGATNLLGLLKHFGSEEKYNEFTKAEKDGSIRYGDLKKELSDSISNYFSDFREKRKELLMDRNKLSEALIPGSEKAREIAKNTMKEVKKLVGLI